MAHSASDPFAALAAHMAWDIHTGGSPEPVRIEGEGGEARGPVRAPLARKWYEIRLGTRDAPGAPVAAFAMTPASDPDWRAGGPRDAAGHVAELAVADVFSGVVQPLFWPAG